MELVTRGWEMLAGSVSGSDVVLLMLRLTLIGATGHLLLALLHRSAPATRHVVAVATLAMMLATPVLGLLGGAAPPVRMTLPAKMTPAVPLEQLDEEPSTRSETVDPASNTRGPVDAREYGSERTLPTNADVLEDDSSATASPVRIPWHRWPAVFVLVAVFGALGLIDLRLISLASIGWIARRARRVDDPRILARLADAAAVLGFERPIEVRFTYRLSVPVVTVFPRPVLLLPDAALGWSDARLHAVLLHELAHVARRDDLGLTVGRLATALLWFHPLAWTLARAARHECERACDAVVIAAGVRASDYAAQLLAIARGATRGRGSNSMSLAFARPSSLEGRLMAILRADATRQPLRRRAEVLLTLALVALLTPVAALRVVAQPMEKLPALKSIELPGEIVKMDPMWSPTSMAPASDADGNRWEDLGPADSKCGEEWADVGRQAYEDGRYETAGTAYERAARAEFETGTSWYRSAASFAMAGRRNQALGALRSALDHDAEVGQKAQTDDDFDAIRSDRRFQMMTQAAPGAVVANHETQVDREAAQQLKSDGMDELRNGDPERAAAMFLRQYSIDSTASSLYNAACSYAVAGREDRALDYLERSLHAGYGDADKLRSDDDLNSLRDQARFRDLVRLAGDLELEYPKGKQRNEAEERAAWSRVVPRQERITREMPRSGRAWFNLGFAELRAKDPAGAREAFLRALDHGYRIGASHYNVACAEAQLGNDEQALRQLEWAEEAGLNVDQMAASDDDLDDLRDNPTFQRMVAQWDSDREREQVAKHKNKTKKSKDSY